MNITYRDHMGDDLSVVNAARVSFGAKSEEFTKQDEGLIAFLARGCTSGDWDELKDSVEYFSNSEEFDEGMYYAEEEFEKLLNRIRKMPAH